MSLLLLFNIYSDNTTEDTAAYSVSTRSDVLADGGDSVISTRGDISTDTRADVMAQEVI